MPTSSSPDVDLDGGAPGSTQLVIAIGVDAVDHFIDIGLVDETKVGIVQFVKGKWQTGERVVMQFENDRTLFKTPDDLGMRPKMQEQIRELLKAKQGYFVMSAMPAAASSPSVPARFSVRSSALSQA